MYWSIPCIVAVAKSEKSSKTSTEESLCICGVSTACVKYLIPRAFFRGMSCDISTLSDPPWVCVGTSTCARQPESCLSNQVAEKPIIAFSDDVTSRYSGMCNAGTCEKWRSKPRVLPLKACATCYSSLWDYQMPDSCW